MMNSCSDHILRLGSFLVSLCTIAVGGFVFLPGFHLVVLEDEETFAKSSILDNSMPAKLLIGIDVALLLMTFVASERW
jgi:hypothetical protein